MLCMLFSHRAHIPGSFETRVTAELVVVSGKFIELKI